MHASSFGRSLPPVIFVSLLCLGCGDGQPSPGGGGAPATPRGPLGKADSTGSCYQSGCSGKASDGSCWCDDLCERYGDCCGDKVIYCGRAAGAADAGAPEPDSGSATSAGSGLASLLSADLFSQMFPNRYASGCNGASLFTYAGLLQAAASFPDFAAEGSDTDRRRELAAFLANISHETTGGWASAPGGPYAWGLCFTEELACAGTLCPQYCSSYSSYSCVAGRSYHGRGPMQLSWNYNYGAAGKALGLDLLSSPEKVASDPKVAFQTALWFWMTAQAPKPSAHDVMTGGYAPSSSDAAQGRQPGFGMTINIINGGYECGFGYATSGETDRRGFYERYAALLGVSAGANLSCARMSRY